MFIPIIIAIVRYIHVIILLSAQPTSLHFLIIIIIIIKNNYKKNFVDSEVS